MSDIGRALRARLGGEDPKKSDMPYTGAYETRVIATTADETMDELIVYTDGAGKPIGVFYGPQVLPFVIEKAEEERRTSIRSIYKSGRAGRIVKLIVSVPKRS